MCNKTLQSVAKIFNFPSRWRCVEVESRYNIHSLHCVILTLLSRQMLTRFGRARGMKSAPSVFSSSLRTEAMPSPVAEAMIESYALMVMVMGTFFLYFCGMVWAFCNPKLSTDEEATEKEIAQRWGEERDFTQQRCRCAAARPHGAAGLTQSTYVNFWDDADGLLLDCSTFCREDGGIINQTGSDMD